MSDAIGVAILGLGNVGSEVARIIESSASDLAARIGAPLEIRGIGVRRVADGRGVPVDLLTDDIEALVARDDVDIVVELMGPVEPARRGILGALNAGKSVVTANKALLAQSAGELAEAAEKARVDLYFEAAVAGAIPVIRPLTQSLAGDSVIRVSGIVNGTTNYILSAMDNTGAGYDTALAEAGELGYAEADPTADVEGYDAAAKAAILASIAFHTKVSADDVYREGITKLSTDDFDSARALQCTIKLLSICERLTDSEGHQRVSARVYPALVPLTHPLASVNGAFNAVFVEAEAAGELMFYGQGAGGAPTASAVLGDLVMAARNRVQGGRGPGRRGTPSCPSRRSVSSRRATTCGCGWQTSPACSPLWPPNSPSVRSASPPCGRRVRSTRRARGWWCSRTRQPTPRFRKLLPLLPILMWYWA
ncbi:homoserine dehydrogenase family protein [Mycobacteroides abscessus subsp. bolletii 1513]|uniref:Homoserine dehydrogenase n=1 Tax=Mycobacteroides abscessus subsp. bolletii 1513 TaxID=1299321 RepID=X8DSH4_9MYCO|nr:homoserine dehydrogenase family protein [Mycobacteroides abscessus subsp. bolletii 1513]